MAGRRKCHRVVCCYFPGRRNTTAGFSHHTRARRKVEFDTFWLEGGGILLLQNAPPPPTSNVHTQTLEGGWCCRNRNYGKSTVLKMWMWVCGCEFMLVRSCICKLEFVCAHTRVCVCVPISFCIMHVWPRSDVYNADHVLSLFIMLRAPDVARNLLYHRSGFSVACSRSLSFFESGKHFSAGLTFVLLLRFHLPERERGKWKWRGVVKRRTLCPLVEDRKDFNA